MKSIEINTQIIITKNVLDSMHVQFSHELLISHLILFFIHYVSKNKYLFFYQCLHYLHKKLKKNSTLKKPVLRGIKNKEKLIFRVYLKKKN